MTKGGGHDGLDGAGCDLERRIEMEPHNDGRKRKDHLVAIEWAIPAASLVIHHAVLRLLQHRIRPPSEHLS
jgi:hypothetical protein